MFRVTEGRNLSLKCFQVERKQPHPGSLQRSLSLTASDEADFAGEDIEAVASSMAGTESIVISRIAKTFTSLTKPEVKAVCGVSLKMYPGEITAILGEWLLP